MKVVVVSSSPPPLFVFSDHHLNSTSTQPLQLRIPHKQQRHRVICLSSSSSSSTSSSVVPDSVVDSDNTPDSKPFSGCKACGKEQVERGCNGEGRIQGGIATIPGFGWWPIKAYRPCPDFLESGGNYRRRGQSMDEVAFGKGKGK